MPYKNKIFILNILILFVLNFFLLSNIFAIETNRNIQSDIDTQYRDKLRRFETENRTKSFKKTKKNKNSFSPQPEQETDSQKKVFSKIIVEYDKDIPKISQAKINKIINTYKEIPIGINEIKTMQYNLQKLYETNGYVFVKIYINADLLNEDILCFIVNEGHIENVIFRNDKNKKYHKLSNSLHGFSFLPFHKNNFLNVKDLDQGIEQLSKLSSFNPVLNIIPAQKDGYFDVEIINKITNRFVLSLGLDNSGFENTGIYRTNSSFSVDDILMLNDNMSFAYTKNFDYDKEAENNYSYFGYLSIPIGYFTFSTSFFNSNYSVPPGTVTGNYTSDGSTKNYNFSLETVISRYKNYKFSLGTSLSLKNSENFVDSQKIDVSSRKLTVADIFLTGIYYFENSMLYSKLSYTKGLDCFDAVKNYNNGDLMPKGQFYSLSSYTQYVHSFVFPVIKSFSNYSANCSLQYSPDILYSNEQISIGGQTSVRGFKETNISGDSGGYIQNDLNIRLSEILKKDGFLKILLHTNLDVFIDYGYVHQSADGKSYQMAGTGAGLAYRIKYFDISGYWSTNVYNTTNLHEEKNIFYFSTNARIYF